MATITGTINNGIIIGTSGSYASPLTIAPSGYIDNTGTGDAVYGPNTGPWTVVNYGRVVGPSGSGDGIELGAGGYVANHTGGLITGRVGVDIIGGDGTVCNDGTITGAGLGAGVYLGRGGSVINGGRIQGTYDGVLVQRSAGAVSNYGTIIGNHGVSLRAGGTVVNDAGGLISGSLGIDIRYGSANVTNAGTVLGGVGAAGIWFSQIGGTITNGSGALISGRDGIEIVNGAKIATVINAGTIAGATHTSLVAGVYLTFGGSVFNSSSGLITGEYGIFIYTEFSDTLSGIVVNGGTILGSGGLAAVELKGAGTVTNLPSGLIKGAGADGIDITISAATVVNAGTIMATGAGVVLSAGGTVVNSGTIAGSSGTAVSFSGTGGALVMLYPGATFAGNVLGAGGALELGSAAAIGTLAGLGTSFKNFGAVTVDGGAHWALSGANTIGNGTLVDNGELVVAPDGSLSVTSAGLVSGVTIGNSGSLTVFGGGTARSTTLSGGSESVASGGADVSAVLSGGSLVVSPGGTTSTATVLSGGSVVVRGNYVGPQFGGHAVSTTIGSGGSLSVMSLGLAQFGTILNGGSEVVNNGGRVILDTINSGGSLSVSSGGSVSSATLNSGGSLSVQSGGIVIGTTIGSGGLLVVSSGVSAGGATINIGGSEIVLAGASATADRINSGAALILQGGSAYQDFIIGTMIVSVGGSTVKDLVVGNQIVSSGGTTEFESIVSDGSQTVLAGGVVSRSTAFVKGHLNIQSGGTAFMPTLSSGGVVELGSGGIIADAVDFSSVSGGIFQIDDTTMPAAFIANLVSGDVINRASVAFDSTGSAVIDPGDVLRVSEGGKTYELNLEPSQDFSGYHFRMEPDGGTGTLLTLEPVCFCRGTLILTDRGEVPVEELVVGDRVKTPSGALKPIVWIGAGRELVSRRNSLARPIIVRQGALADHVPHRDLYLTHGHALYLDSVLIPVENLINHRSIVWDDSARAVEFFHIELADHDVVLANGARAETYYDAGNRALFHNTRPGSAAGEARPTFAPVLSSGPVVERAWTMLFERSGGRIEHDTTEDPDLHLVVGGRRLDAVRIEAGAYTFAFDAAPDGGLHLCSRSGVPSLLGVTAHDHRRLGVALARIEIAQPGIATVFGCDAPVFGEGGCHPPEDGYAWTDGVLALPQPLFAHLDGGFTLIVQIELPGMRYPLPSTDSAAA